MIAMVVAFLLYVLSTVGMSHIVVDGTILQWFRDLVKRCATAVKVPKLGGVVDCYMCSGTWCGFFMGWVWLSQSPFEIFACGCAGGFIANFAAVVLNWIEAQTVLNFPMDTTPSNQNQNNES
jgi:hypothetical protein